MSPLDTRQRQLSLVAAALAAILTLSIWLPRLGEHVGKNQAPPALALASGLILSGLLASSVLLNKRYFVGFASLVVAFLGPWGSGQFIVALPFLGLSGWLVITAGRQAREDAEARRRAAGGSDSRAAKASPSGNGSSRRSAAPAPGRRPGWSFAS